jgi:hypothetical protein
MSKRESERIRTGQRGETRHIGRYTIRVLPDRNGAFIVSWNVTNRDGNRVTHRNYVPPDEKIKDLYLQNPRAGTVYNHLLNRALLYSGRRNVKDGRKALGLSPLTRRTSQGIVPSEVTDADIEAAIRNFWPEEQVEKALRGEDMPLKKMTEFMNHNKRAYNALVKRRKVKEFMDRVYPGVYELVSSRGRTRYIDIAQLREELLTLHWSSGARIGSEKSLEKSRDPRQRRTCSQVKYIAKHGTPDLFGGRKRKFMEVVEEITGLSQEELCMDKNKAVPQISGMAEDLTYFLFLWGSLVNLDFLSLNPRTRICRKGEAITREVTFSQGGKTEATPRACEQWECVSCPWSTRR